MLLNKSSYPLKCLQCDRIVVEEISVSSQLSCEPQKNVSQHLKVDIMYRVQYQFLTVVKSMISEQQELVEVGPFSGDHGQDTLLSVPLSTQVYKWVPANSMLGVTLRWTSIPSRGE